MEDVPQGGAHHERVGRAEPTFAGEGRVRHDGGDVGEERRPAEGRPAAADEFVLPVAMFVVGVKRRIFRV